METQDLIAIIRQLIAGGLIKDAKTREDIAKIRTEMGEKADEAVIQLARDTIAETDKQAQAFIDRLEK